MIEWAPLWQTALFVGVFYAARRVVRALAPAGPVPYAEDPDQARRVAALEWACEIRDPAGNLVHDRDPRRIHLDPPPKAVRHRAPALAVHVADDGGYVIPAAEAEAAREWMRQESARRAAQAEAAFLRSVAEHRAMVLGPDVEYQEIRTMESADPVGYIVNGRRVPPTRDDGFR